MKIKDIKYFQNDPMTELAYENLPLSTFYKLKYTTVGSETTIQSMLSMDGKHTNAIANTILFCIFNVRIVQFYAPKNIYLDNILHHSCVLISP